MSIINKIRSHKKLLYPIFYLVLFIIIVSNIIKQSTKDFIEKRKEREEKEGFSSTGPIPEQVKKNRIEFIKNWKLKGTSVVEKLIQNGLISDSDDITPYSNKINTQPFIDNDSKGSMREVSKEITPGKVINYVIPCSYNSCCGGKKKQGYMDVEILRMILFCGARLVDFEVYNQGGEPVVGCSWKQGENDSHTVLLEDAFQVIKEKIQNEGDGDGPIFVNLRINPKLIGKGEQDGYGAFYKEVGKLIRAKFGNFSIETEKYIKDDASDSQINNHLREFPISTLNKKVIIIASNKDDNFWNPLSESPDSEDGIGKFYKSINLMPLKTDALNQKHGNTLIKEHRENLVEAFSCDETIKSSNIKDCYDKSRATFHMVIPGIGKSVSNTGQWVESEKHGYQFICMYWQTVDNSMIQYYNMFMDKNSLYMEKNSNKKLNTYILNTNKDMSKLEIN